MSVLAQEEANNAPLIAALKSQIQSTNVKSDDTSKSQSESNVGELSTPLMPATTV